jgi:hypothetical protein
VNVEVHGEVLDQGGTYVVNFFSNGMSDPFVLRLSDEDQRTASILVDSLSGKVTIEYGH